MKDEADRIRRASERYGRATRWTTFLTPGERAVLSERNACLLDELRSRFAGRLGEVRLLDAACGRGEVLELIANEGVPQRNLAGIDPVENRIVSACERCPDADLRTCSPDELPFDDATFDAAVAFELFSAVLEAPRRRRIAQQILRVLRPHGVVFYYDLRVTARRDAETRAIRREEAQDLFPGCRAELRSISLLPWLARGLGRAARALYPVLTGLPALRSHYFGVMTKA